MSNLSLDRLLTYAEDSAHTSGDEGQFVLAVTQDTLASSADDGDYSAFKVNSKGELYVKSTDSDALLTTIDADTSSMATDLGTIDTNIGTINTNISDLTKAEDSAHVSGDKGVMSLAVRNDAGTALAADQDYIPLTTNASGELRVAASVTLAAPDTAITAQAFTVGTTEVDVSPGGAGRDEIIIQNLGPQPIYIGPTGVTTSTGLQIGKRSNVTLGLGPSVDVFAISGTAGNDVRVMEIR